MLHLGLLLIELLDRLGVDILVVVWRLATHVGLRGLGHESAIAHTTRDERHRTRLLLDPEVLGRLEVVSEDRYDLLNLLVAVGVHEEVQRCLIGTFFAAAPGDVQL